MANGTDIQVYHQKDTGAVGWGSSGAEYVCESKGVFITNRG